MYYTNSTKEICTTLLIVQNSYIEVGSRDPLHIDLVPQLKCSEDREDLDKESNAGEDGNQGYQASGKQQISLLSF